MCGRYVSRDQAAIEREFHIRVSNPFERVYNAAPTMQLPVIRAMPTGPAAGPAVREAVAMRWGLVPGWWSQPAPPTSTINARSEEAAAKPMWRQAVRHFRALVPALGWYEWQVHRGVKQPFYIHPDGDEGVCFAGLWSERSGADGQVQLSFAILTRAASAALAPVHDRMPVVLPPATYDEWLAPWPDGHAERLAACVARSLEQFAYHPVARYVNSPRNQGERCIEPVADGALPGSEHQTDD
jgi:putative SOS response-associated peptidase YedK